LVTIALISAVRVTQLVIGCDGSTGQKLTDVIENEAEVPALRAINATLEGRTEKLKNPFDPASLAWYAWIAARLGGWSGYTSKAELCPQLLAWRLQVASRRLARTRPISTPRKMV
jgi:hypothetical protein